MYVMRMEIKGSQESFDMLNAALAPAWRLSKRNAEWWLEWLVNEEKVDVDYSDAFDEKLEQCEKAFKQSPSCDLAVEFFQPREFWWENGTDRKRVNRVVEVSVTETIVIARRPTAKGWGGDGTPVSNEERCLRRSWDEMLPAIKRVKAMELSAGFRMVVNDWERKGDPEPRAYAIYMELIKKHFGYPKKQTKRNKVVSSNPLHPFVEKIEHFGNVMNNPQYLREEARHAEFPEKYNPVDPTLLYMTDRREMKRLLTALVEIWEDDITRQALEAAYKSLLDKTLNKAPNGS